MHLGGNAEAEAVQPNESGGVVLVVSLGRIGFHGGDVRIVEADRGLAPGVDDVPLVEFNTNGAGDVALAFGDKSLERQALGSEPVSVVNEFGVFWN